MPESPEQISNEIQDLLQQAVLNDYPNPERKGCVGEQVVREVATRQMPVRDSAWEHITHCSPCYREFLGFRAELADARRRLVRRNRIVLVTALAAAGIAGILIWTRGSHGVQKPPVVARKIQTPGINTMVAKVDLQPASNGNRCRTTCRSLRFATSWYTAMIWRLPPMAAGFGCWIR